MTEKDEQKASAEARAAAIEVSFVLNYIDSSIENQDSSMILQ